MCINLLIFSYPSVSTFVLDAQMNRLIETVLLSTHNITLLTCFDALHSSQQFFSHVGMGLPALNQD